MQISWAELNGRIISCQVCPLVAGIHSKVPGQGNPHARLMLIGEGPGAEEDRQGLAFVGAAGQLLTRMLAAIGLTRDEVFIANAVKCRPPGNRVPLPAEIAACLPYLRAQTALIRPQVILLLGATALRAVLGDEKRITKCRGEWTVSKGVYILPTFHPAALLRDPDKKRDAWHDIQLVQSKLAELQDKE
jgi:uracil-DNA glycosylase family 4